MTPGGKSSEGRIKKTNKVFYNLPVCDLHHFEESDWPVLISGLRCNFGAKISMLLPGLDIILE